MLDKGGANAYCWLGNDANDAEKEYCQKLPGILAPGAAVNVVNEGEEGDDFWAAVGGKTEYQDFAALGIRPGFEPRLF